MYETACCGVINTAAAPVAPKAETTNVMIFFMVAIQAFRATARVLRSEDGAGIVLASLRNKRRGARREHLSRVALWVALQHAREELFPLKVANFNAAVLIVTIIRT